MAIGKKNALAVSKIKATSASIFESQNGVGCETLTCDDTPRLTLRKIKAELCERSFPCHLSSPSYGRYEMSTSRLILGVILVGAAGGGAA